MSHIKSKRASKFIEELRIFTEIWRRGRLQFFFSEKYICTVREKYSDFATTGFTGNLFEKGS